MDNETDRHALTVIDNRTGRSYEIPISEGTVRAMDFRQIRAHEGDFGLMVYDPGYPNTASCRSAITHIDGETSVLEYRGYPIEQLAEKSTYLETAYLLVNGELPTKPQLEEWIHDITFHTYVHENIKKTTTPTRWACSSGPSAPSPRSTRTPSTYPIRYPVTSRRNG